MKHKLILTVIVVMIAIISNMYLNAQGVDYIDFGLMVVTLFVLNNQGT